MPELELLDSDLEIGAGSRAPWVGVDANGRLVLVVRVEGDDDAAALAALDALAFARENASLLASHLSSPRLRAERPPLVVLVAERYSDKLLSRLAGLDPDRLRVLEQRVLSSSRGQRTYLVAIAPGRREIAAAPAFDPQAFVASLPEALREVGELVLRRVARIDEEVVATSGEGSVSWRWGRELLGTIRPGAHALEAEVPHGTIRWVESERDVELFVEEVLARYVELLGEDEESEEPVLQPVESAAMTPEELEAFRQPG